MQCLRTGASVVYVFCMELSQWIEEITRGATAQEISKATDIPLRTVQHQLASGRMSLENKILIGVAYRHHPMRTLIEWEVINPEWEQVPDIHAALRLAGEEDLADEVLRRMRLGAQTDALIVPIDDYAARRSNTEPGDVRGDSYDGTVRDWDDSIPHAADSSPDEIEERLKRGEDPVD